MTRYFLILSFLIPLSCQGQTSRLEGVIETEREFILTTHSKFINSLAELYGFNETNKLLMNFVNDFAEKKIPNGFFADVVIDTDSKGFKSIFKKNDTQNSKSEFILQDGIVEIGMINENQEYSQLDTNRASLDLSRYSFNINSSLAKYFEANKSDNYKVNNLLEMLLAGLEIAPEISAIGISTSFSEKEFNDISLQIYILVEHFILVVMNDYIE